MRRPFHHGVRSSWPATIVLETIWLNAMMLFPVNVAGAFLGLKITAYLPDDFYRKFVIGVTVLSAGLLF